jgi:hypothetical protein
MSSVALIAGRRGSYTPCLIFKYLRIVGMGILQVHPQKKKIGETPILIYKKIRWLG